jgi:hypothetical protein
MTGWKLARCQSHWTRSNDRNKNSKYWPDRINNIFEQSTIWRNHPTKTHAIKIVHVPWLFQIAINYQKYLFVFFSLNFFFPTQKWKDIKNNGTTWKLVSMPFKWVPMLWGFNGVVKLPQDYRTHWESTGSSYGQYYWLLIIIWQHIGTIIKTHWYSTGSPEEHHENWHQNTCNTHWLIPEGIFKFLEKNP